MPAGVSQVIGIDLGTTFSVVGIWKHDRVEIITNEEGYRITPSCVSYTSDELLVGTAAKKKQVNNLKNTVYDIKRLIGKSYDPTMAENMGWPFTINEGENHRPQIDLNYKNERRVVSPEEISSLILKKMKETVERNIGESITKAVITVPAYFSQGQRQCTIDAAKLTNLEVMELITEPAAAAYAYGFHNKAYNDHNLLVFDMGGGTFDTVVMRVSNGNFEVISINGDTQLGGRDIDSILMKHFAEKIKKDYSVDITENKEENHRRRHKLLKECIELKHTLSSDINTELYLGDILTDEDDTIHINRDQFNELCSKLFGRIMSITRNSLSDVKMEPSDIHKVLLIGGSSRIPKLLELLGNMFGKDKLDFSMNPDEAVAYGATVRAAQLCNISSFNTPNITLTEATPLSIGASTSKGCFGIVIPRNTCLPCRKSETRVTCFNDQEVMGFNIYEGERPLCENNNKLGYFSLNNLTPGVAGSAKVLLTFDLNKNGILKVTAAHNNETSELTINYIQSKLPQKSVEDLIRDAELFKEQDEKVSQAMGSKTSLEQSVEKVKYRILKESLSQEYKNQFQQAVNDIEDWLQNSTSKEKNVFDEKEKEFTQICNNINIRKRKADEVLV